MNKNILYKNVKINNLKKITLTQNELQNDNINNKEDLIISVLNKSSGFFSQLFFMFNHYLYCYNNFINFKLESSNWLFTYKDGWTDYFEDINLQFHPHIAKSHKYNHGNVIFNYTINDYKEIINKIYKYNKTTISKINSIKQELDLNDNNYDSIFIRRGDKLYSESILINALDFVKLLLTINPECKKIFLQTDDYNTFIEIDNYLKSINSDIVLLTLCDKNNKGVIVFNIYKYNFIDKTSIYNQNKEYIKTILSDIKNTKSVQEMNNCEIYDHTINMIVGLDIVCKSNICITDYQSNCSRFIKLYHNNINNVYNVVDKTNSLDLTKKICPSYSF